MISNYNYFYVKVMLSLMSKGVTACPKLSMFSEFVLKFTKLILHKANTGG